MKRTLTEDIISKHLVNGELSPGNEIGLRMDQTLTRDATGTMVYIEFESLGIDRVKPEVAVSYSDHNIIQTNYKNADDHRFLQSCAAKYGVTLSLAGNGVSRTTCTASASVYPERPCSAPTATPPPVDA